MANSPSVEKVLLSQQIDIKASFRLEKEATRLKCSKSAMAASLLDEATKNVELDEDDRKEIAAIISKNRERRHSQRLS